MKNLIIIEPYLLILIHGWIDNEILKEGVMVLELSNYRDGISIAQDTCYVEDYATKVFVYNVDGLLIDTGPSSRGEYFRPWFASQEIAQAALTHNHEDHSGNAEWIQQNLNSPVYLHPDAFTYAHEEGAYPQYRMEMWGPRPAFKPEPMPERLTTGKYTFEVLDTPGHTIYHNCFYEPEQGWLFTGDLYLGTKLFVCFFEENIRQTIDTLERLVKLDFDTIFCAHAGVIENGKIRLGRKIENLKDLQEQVQTLRNKGMNDKEIDDKLNGFKLSITEISCGEWSSYNIIRTI